MLIGFDLLLALVLGLLLYSISARDPRKPPGAFDVVQVVLVISALLADAVALWAIAARISEFGFSPNRVAALGENVILLVNLAWSAVLYIRFLRGRGTFADLERWQTDYLPVYAVWATIVVIAFPPCSGTSDFRNGREQWKVRVDSRRRAADRARGRRRTESPRRFGGGRHRRRNRVAEGFGWANLDTKVAVTPKTQFGIGTASAVLTSAAAGLLLERGSLKLDEKIQAYVPEFPEQKWPVTLR